MSKLSQLLTLARELNPWHDGIKNYYLLAIKQYIKATSILAKNSPCDLIITRIDYLNQISPDNAGRFGKIVKKCNHELLEIEEKIAIDTNILEMKTPFTSRRVERIVFDTLEPKTQKKKMPKNAIRLNVGDCKRVCKSAHNLPTCVQLLGGDCVNISESADLMNVTSR